MEGAITIPYRRRDSFLASRMFGAKEARRQAIAFSSDVGGVNFSPAYARSVTASFGRKGECGFLLASRDEFGNIVAESRRMVFARHGSGCRAGQVKMNARARDADSNVDPGFGLRADESGRLPTLPVRPDRRSSDTKREIDRRDLSDIFSDCSS